MEYLNVIYAQSCINATIASLRLSIDDIKKKNPNRTDLITPMEKHLKGLMETFTIFREMEKELTLLKSMNFNYHKENMELRFDNDNLKSKCENLMNGL